MAGDRPVASVQVRVTAVTEIDTDNVICAAMAPERSFSDGLGEEGIEGAPRVIVASRP